MIVATGLRFPEGPAFDAEGRLHCCCLGGGYVVRIGQGGAVERVVESPRPNGLAFHPDDDALWITDSGARTILRARPREAARPVTSAVLLGPNDLVFHSDGSVYFTDPMGSSGQNPIGAVYRLDPAGRLERVATGLAFPNGLALTGAGKGLIVAETKRDRLLHIDLGSGRVEPFCDVGRGPDGITQGPDGLLYVALFREGCVAVVATNGQVLRRLTVQDDHPTNCVTRDGYLFVTLSATGRIERLSLEG